MGQFSKSLLILAFAALLTGAPPSDRAKEFYNTIRNGNSAQLQALLQDATWKTVKDNNGNTPLMYSAAVGNLDSMKMLLAAGADVNARNDFEVTPLLLCATEEAKVRLLLSKRADPNARAKSGRTALLLAASTPGTSPILKLLLEAGADLKTKEENPGAAPVVVAAEANDSASFLLLVNHDASVEGPAGMIALLVAAGHGNLDIMKSLLDRKVPSDMPSPNGLGGKVKQGDVAVGSLTPLHLAATSGGLAAVQLLLERGANPNKQDVRGMTPLMLAIGTDHQDSRVIRLLLSHGADPNIKSKAGETALDWAKKFNHPDVLDALHLKATQPVTAPFTKSATLRDSIEKSTALLQRTSGTFFVEGGCSSCHSHNLISMALQRVHAAGIPVPNEPLETARMAQNTSFWGSQQTSLMLRGDPPGGTTMTGYALLQFAADNIKADATTDAMVHNIAVQQQQSGVWHSDTIARPPMQDSEFTDTAIAVHSLALYGPPSRKEEYAAQILRATEWLRQAKPVTTEDTNMQLLGLLWSGAASNTLNRYTAKIVSMQRADGGWAQTPYLSSDAYATGQTLATLAEAGMSKTDESYRKGVAFLLSTQLPDGSWHVVSRAPKIQPYFQSGFPHNHDQWISMAATAWATAGLAYALPNQSASVK